LYRAHNSGIAGGHGHAVDATSATVANQQPDDLRAARHLTSSLARFGLRIIPAMQPSATRGKDS
jgi:hypothetical protein